MKRPHLVLAIALLPVAASAGPEERAIPALAAGQESDGRALIDENCLYCHDDSYIRSLNLPREEWEGVLDMMIGMGMPPLESEVQERSWTTSRKSTAPGEFPITRRRDVSGRANGGPPLGVSALPAKPPVLAGALAPSAGVPSRSAAFFPDGDPEGGKTQPGARGR